LHGTEEITGNVFAISLNPEADCKNGLVLPVNNSLDRSANNALTVVNPDLFQMDINEISMENRQPTNQPK